MAEFPAYADLTQLATEHLQPGEIIIHEEEIKRRTEELAQEIAEKYRGKNLLVVCLLKGAATFTVHLMEALSKAGLDDGELDFMKIRSTDPEKGTESSGDAKITMEMSIDPRNRHVLFVDDIADTNLTLTKVADDMQEKGLASFATAVLLEKPSRHLIPFPLDYVGFKIPGVWVEGHGLDTKERNRFTPHIVKGPTYTGNGPSYLGK